MFKEEAENRESVPGCLFGVTGGGMGRVRGTGEQGRGEEEKKGGRRKGRKVR